MKVRVEYRYPEFPEQSNLFTHIECKSVTEAMEL